MGKSVDELHLSDEPLHPHRQHAPQDLRNEPWYQFLQDIDGLIASGQYQWAESTLRGIQQTVEYTKRVTEGQQRAVKNIEESRQTGRLPSERRYHRRYEGWR